MEVSQSSGKIPLNTWVVESVTEDTGAYAGVAAPFGRVLDRYFIDDVEVGSDTFFEGQPSTPAVVTTAPQMTTFTEYLIFTVPTQTELIGRVETAMRERMPWRPQGGIHHHIAHREGAAGGTSWVESQWSQAMVR